MIVCLTIYIVTCILGMIQVSIVLENESQKFFMS